MAPTDRVSAEAATVIDENQISDLPNNGRDWASFTLLAPFAQDDGGGDQRTIRFAGRARDDNNFSIDGVDAGGIQEQAQKSQTRLQISQDAIEEYRVNSALYDVEYGTQSGGQIDVETKSGTNDYHGTVFGYFRNSVFDARNYNDYNLAGNPAIPPFRLGQYGMTFGGPIKKNNTFFFISYEGIRQLQSTTEQVIVPAGVCCGDFTGAGEPGLVTTPYQKYVLDQATSLGYGAQMCQVMQGYAWRSSVGSIDGCTPRFVFPDSAFQYQGGNQDQVTFAAPTTVHEDTWLVRIDHKISENTLLYGRAQRDISLVDAPNGSSSLQSDKLQTINHPANYMLALEHTFRPTLFNEVKFYVNRAPFHNPQASALPYAVSTNDFVGLNNDSADIEVGTTYGLIDNLIWSHGRHTFKMGMEYRRVRLNQGQTSNNNLTFSDDYSLSQASLANINYIAPWCCHRLRRNFFMPYFQDEWKATPTVTLTAGLRWDYYGVAHEATNRTTVFDLNQFHGVCLGTGSFNVGPQPRAHQHPGLPREPGLVQRELCELRSTVGFILGSQCDAGKDSGPYRLRHLSRRRSERRFERRTRKRYLSCSRQQLQRNLRKCFLSESADAIRTAGSDVHGCKRHWKTSQPSARAAARRATRSLCGVLDVKRGTSTARKFPGFRSVSRQPRRAIVFARGRKPLYAAGHVQSSRRTIVSARWTSIIQPAIPSAQSTTKVISDRAPTTPSDSLSSAD